MPDEILLTDEELTERLRYATGTLAKSRRLGTGPPFVKIYRKVLYRWSDVERWLAARRVASTGEAKARGLDKPAAETGPRRTHSVEARVATSTSDAVTRQLNRALTRAS